MRNWVPDPKATIFKLTYHFVGLGRQTTLKCPYTAEMAVHAFADDFRVQALSVTPIDADGQAIA